MSPNHMPTPHEALTDHPYFRYRGCAPDEDDPSRAAGDLEVPVTAWWDPDVDGGEPQKVRIAREAAAKRVCAGCAVLVECRTYANSLTPDGKLAEPFFVRGGQTALERHKRLIALKQAEAPAPADDAAFTTVQKRRLLYAFARHTDPWAIARVAGMDLRTANWQRSSLVRLLGLSKTASRNDVLKRALKRGLVDAKWVRLDDGSVPAVVRDMKTTPGPVPAPLRTKGRRPARSKFSCIEGQLGFDDLAAAPEATVHTLSTRSVRSNLTEAAA